MRIWRHSDMHFPEKENIQENTQQIQYANNSTSVTRIISARKANKLEEENYHEHFSEYLPTK